MYHFDQFIILYNYKQCSYFTIVDIFTYANIINTFYRFLKSLQEFFIFHNDFIFIIFILQFFINGIFTTYIICIT